MSYSKKLSNPQWQRKRLEILQRDKWMCTCCHDATNELQIHHLDYIPGIEPQDYPDDMLTTLCINCHNKEQGREKMETHLATTLKMKGFLLSDLLGLSCLIDTNDQFTKSLLKTLRNG